MTVYGSRFGDYGIKNGTRFRVYGINSGTGFRVYGLRRMRGHVTSTCPRILQGFVYVFLVTGGEVVQADDFLVQLEEGFQEV